VLNIANQTNLILILSTALKVRNHIILDWNTRCQSIPFNGQQPQKNAFRIIKISHIKELISVETKKANDEKETTEISLDDIETAYAHASSAPQKIYIDQLNQREREAVKLAGQQAARIGVGVSKEAQAIFDALSKT
jgi:predicted HicB family RNase H-like nuclease